MDDKFKLWLVTNGCNSTKRRWLFFWLSLMAWHHTTLVFLRRYYTVFWWSPIKGVGPSLYATGIPFSPKQALSSLPCQCLCSAKVFLSHRSQARNEHRLGQRFLLLRCPWLGALQHSLRPVIHSIHLAIWTKACLFYDFCGSPWIFIQIHNFPSCRRRGWNFWTLAYSSCLSVKLIFIKSSVWCQGWCGLLV